jgi:hypothetical protein
VKSSYEQALKDWKALWAIGPAYDMTGAYVDQDDLYSLLLSPTKATARKCLHRQICYWLETGTDECRNIDELRLKHPEVEEIARRYGY